jgi:hemoglobin
MRGAVKGGLSRPRKGDRIMTQNEADRAAPRRESIPVRETHAGVTPELVRDLVHTFYDRVRREPVIGPIFEARLAGKWDAHLAKLVDFWSGMALRTDAYKGRPFPPHVPLGLEPRHFERWLALFRQTASEVCPPPAAAFFVDRAERIAESFQMVLGIGVKAWRPPE